jgi:DNA-binding transcriptional LysR family regulator
MTYEQLVALDAIVTEGSFRAAAERLNKSQSAISHMLKKLEHDLDILLLSREDYRPKLTPAGEVFYRQATRVLLQMQALKGAAKNLVAGQEAEVRLAITATYPLENLLPVIGNATALYPATHIRLSTESMSGAIENLLQGKADIVIATMDGVPADQVEAIAVASVTMLPVAHPSFEPATTDHVKTISEMQSYIQVVVADSGSNQSSQSRDLLPGGLRWTVSDFAAKKQIVLAGMGWGGIPEHLISEELINKKLVILNLEAYPPRQSHLYKIRRRDATLGLVAQSIWEQLG